MFNIHLSKEETHHLSIIIEVIAFFFVTLDLYGKTKLKALNEYFRGGTVYGDGQTLRDKIRVRIIYKKIVTGNNYRYTYSMRNLIVLDVVHIIIYVLIINRFIHSLLPFIAILISIILLFLLLGFLLDKSDFTPMTYTQVRYAQYLIGYALPLILSYFAISYLLLQLVLLIGRLFKVFPVSGVMLIIGSILFCVSKLLEYNI